VTAQEELSTSRAEAVHVPIAKPEAQTREELLDEALAAVDATAALGASPGLGRQLDQVRDVRAQLARHVWPEGLKATPLDKYVASYRRAQEALATADAALLELIHQETR
jgi:hypothetical protein